jgi:hypothetical protein
MVTYPSDLLKNNEIKKMYKRVRGTPITQEWRMNEIKSATG